MKSYRFILICLCLFIFTGCTKYYRVLQDMPTPTFKNYDSIFVGWIDLDENRWQMYGYNSIIDWQEVINDANMLSLPQYFQKIMPNKKITTASSKNDVDPRGSDLYLKFSNANYIASKESGPGGFVNIFIGRRGPATSTGIHVKEKDVLAVTIDFIDVKEAKSLYTVSVLIHATSGSGYYGWTFENRINNAFYNTAYFINKKLQGKIGE